MRAFALSLALICALAAGYVAYLKTSGPPVTESSFATFSDARSGEAADAWIPEFLPKSAREIRVRRGVDPSFMLLEFRFAPEDLEPMIGSFEPVREERLASSVLDEARQSAWHTPPPEGALVFEREARDPLASPERVHLFVHLGTNQAWYYVD